MKIKMISMIIGMLFTTASMANIGVNVTNSGNNEAKFIGASSDHHSKVTYVALFPAHTALYYAITETLNPDATSTEVSLQYKLGSHNTIYCTLHIKEQKVSSAYTTYETWAEYSPKNTGSSCNVVSGNTNSPTLYFN